MEKSWQTNPERLVQVLKVRESLRLLIKNCLFDLRRKLKVQLELPSKELFSTVESLIF